MRIQVLGPNCAWCRQLTANAQKAVAELGLHVAVEKVEDVEEVDASVGFTPALAVNGRVRASGKVLTVEEIKALLRS